MDVQFRPITLWPGKMTSFRHASKFRAGYSDTLQLLDRELLHLKAANVGTA